MTGGVLDLDHVTIAGQSLDALVEPFERRGATPQYGGPHAHGATHMSQLCFSDGSYLELLASYGDEEPPRWTQFIRENAGLCAWAIEVDDVDTATSRVTEAGVEVDGPFANGRERPDGTEAEWRFAFPGPGEPGTYLPFLIEDRTPRTARVPEQTTDIGGFDGIGRVVVGVTDLSGAIESYRAVFGLDTPEQYHDTALGAEVAVFDAEPVVLAMPDDDPGWLARRIQTYGPCPAACVFTRTGSTPDEFARVIGESAWNGERVRWLDLAPESWGRFGVIG